MRKGISVILASTLLTAACGTLPGGKPGNPPEPPVSTVDSQPSAVEPPPCPVAQVIKDSEAGGKVNYSVVFTNFDGYMGGVKHAQYIAGPLKLTLPAGQRYSNVVTIANGPDGTNHMECSLKFDAQ